MSNESGHPLLFSIRSYSDLSGKISADAGLPLAKVEVKEFPDGERYQRILDKVQNQDVVLLGGTITDADTLEFYDLASTIVKQGARSLTLLVPYFAYSTMERAVLPGEVVTAKTRAQLISSIPLARNGNQIAMLDLHTEGLPHYFEGGITTYHLYGKKVVTEACHKLGGTDFVLACTDAGRAKWVESLANDMGVQAAFVFKQRLSGDETRITGVSADVQGKTVIIYDDMIRTGGSLIQAANAYKNAGAKTIAAVSTHGVLPGKSEQKLQDSGLFQTIVVTDSHPNALRLKSDFLKVETVAGIFSDFLRENLFNGAGGL